MDEMNLDRAIRDTLHTCADTLEAPEDMKARVKFAVNSGAPAKKYHVRNWKKRLIAFGAGAAIAVTTEFAGGAGCISGRAWGNQNLSYEKTAGGMTAISDTIRLPEEFGGFVFREGYKGEVAAEYEGKREGYMDEVTARFQKDGVKLELNVHKRFTVFDGMPEEDRHEAGEKQEMTLENGITLTFHDTAFMFVPPDYEPTEEEKQAEANGEIVISYGADEVEHRQFQSVQWEKDGVSYDLYGYETGLDAQTMFGLAAEIIAE